MDLPFEFVFGVGIAISGTVYLWKREVVFGFGRPNPIFSFRISGLTAVIFSLGLILGGVALVIPFTYRFLHGSPLPNDLTGWIPAIGYIIIGIGIISAAISGILRTAKAAGDDIYARNKALN